MAYLFLVMRFFQSLGEMARVTANIRGNWPRVKVLGDWYRESYLPDYASRQKKPLVDKCMRRLSGAIGVAFQDVSYGWSDDNRVLDHANFVIPEGSVTAITGPSGAGKTTLSKKIQESDIEINSSENTNKMVAVLFTDIDGFTSISENLKSSEVIELLSEYQDRMIKPIFKNSGTVDKFIGDAVMATFGTPISQGNDVQNAFNCAREMQIAMRQWAKERSDSGLSPITHRIGIHFGSCVVGNIGNEDRKEFTVIGDVVNVANRVCDACKDLETDFIITDEVKSRLNEAIQSETIENFSIRGKKTQITVHKVAV